MRRTGGRPSSLTPERHVAIVAAVRQGLYTKQAVENSGITESTYYRWIERGRQGEEPYESFMVDVRKASAEAALDMLGVIWKAATTDWRAAAWYLERRYPNDYGRRATGNSDERTSTEAQEAADADEVMRKIELLVAHGEHGNSHNLT